MSDWKPATWLAGIMALLAVAIVLGAGRGEAAPVLFQAAGGEEIYLQRCAACHGANGEGGFGTSLAQSDTPLADQLAIIRDGRGAMPAFGRFLSDPELQAVAAASAAFQGTTPPSSDQAGAGVYAGSCAGCHGADREGGVGPNLKVITASPDELAAIVNEGQGTMPGFAGRLSAEEVEAVAAFLLALSGGADGSPVPDLAAQGGVIFTENCVRCHGADASGGVGPALKTSTLSGAQMVQVISNGRGAMPGWSALLTAEEIDAVVAFIEETRSIAGGPDAETIGREVFVSTCSACHGLDGKGGLGPSLANTRLTANEIISRVYGGHPNDMPAFEGLLDAVQVQDVARYVLSIEGEPSSRLGLVLAVVAAVVVVAGTFGLWYRGWFDRLRRPPADSVGD